MTDPPLVPSQARLFLYKYLLNVYDTTGPARSTTKGEAASL